MRRIAETCDSKRSITLTRKTVFLPAFALSVRADAPTGKDSEGVDTAVKLIASKLIGRTSFFNALHINVSWLRNGAPQAGERDNYYSAVLGYAARLNADTVAIVDLVREEEKQQGSTTKLAEIGVRRQITPLLVLAAAAGVGLDDESPDFRATLALQYGFGGTGPRPERRH